MAVIAADEAGRLAPTAEKVIQAARLLARSEAVDPVTLLMAPPDLERPAVEQVLELFRGRVIRLAAPAGVASAEIRNRLLRDIWPLTDRPRAVVGESWTADALAALGAAAGTAVPQPVASRVRRLALEAGVITLETVRAQGKVRALQTVGLGPGSTWWIALAADAEVAGAPAASLAPPRVERWAPKLDRLFSRADMPRLLEELKQEAGLARLSDADFIIDVGFGVGNRDGYEAVIDPLEQALRRLGVKSLVIGGSRKVTEELRLLPPDRQIGQSGVRVNPQLLLAIGVSGAPQHLNYIGPRATILAFNRDPEAPLMTLNQRQPRPKVFPIAGDLFATVPAFIAALEEQTVEAPPGPAAAAAS